MGDLLIAYKREEKIKVISLLTLEEIPYVSSTRALSEKIISLLSNDHFNIYNFCNQERFHYERDLSGRLEGIMKAAERYQEGAYYKTDETECAIRIFVDQLYRGIGNYPKYKRFRDLGLYVKSLEEEYMVQNDIDTQTVRNVGMIQSSEVSKAFEKILNRPQKIFTKSVSGGEQFSYFPPR